MRDVLCHETALVEAEDIGLSTRIGAFARVLSGARVGRECDIGDRVFIADRARIGNRVTIECGVQIWSGITLEDDVYVEANATFSNAPHALGKRCPGTDSGTAVRHGATIGANATIVSGVTIGMGSMVRAGAVVTRSVPPKAIVAGNPASIIGYVDTEESVRKKSTDGDRDQFLPVSSSVSGAKLISLPRIADMRGNLTVGEFSRTIPFEPKRYFMVFDVPSVEARGEHAHRTCHQFLICVRGNLSVVADDGVARQEFLLDRPDLGLHLAPMVWGIQYKYTRDALLLVFASHYYDSADYIRDYGEFLDQVGRGK